MEGGWSKLIVPREEVEISTVLACGQSFRWKNSGSNPEEWIGVFGNHLWVLKQNDFQIEFKVIGWNKAVIQKPLDSQALEELLRNYFQLDISLPSLYKEWASRDPKFPTKDFQGIRMLAQDPIENLFSFICSSNNNIQRISQMVEKLCLNYGEKIIDYKGKAYSDFPPVEKLIGDKVEKKLREESFGYRAGFISKTAEKIVANGGVKWIESLKSLQYEDARTQLQTLPGVGRKVADCICLMSLNFPKTIPVDTHIHQVAKEYLPHLAKVKTLTDKVYSEIVDYFVSIYGEYAGWAHSVLFASTLRHLKSPDAKANGKSTVKKSIKCQSHGSEHKDASTLSEISKITVSKEDDEKKQPRIQNKKRKPKSDPVDTGSHRRSKRLAK